ncbi:MAG: hypothetical protein J0H99_08355 [Rhodospirillales bacterium]|nr:hypothetical protein [Rhodospirillales bacterium]MBN8906619.1 hypothetical protein [Rhodospirillales bacterium]
MASTVPADVAMIDSSAVKAQRASAGGKGGCGPGNRLLARRPHDKDPCCLQAGVLADEHPLPSARQISIPFDQGLVAGDADSFGCDGVN